MAKHTYTPRWQLRNRGRDRFDKYTGIFIFKGLSRIQRGRTVSLPAQSIESGVVRFCKIIEEEFQLKCMRRCLSGMKNREKLIGMDILTISISNDHFKDI